MDNETRSALTPSLLPEWFGDSLFLIDADKPAGAAKAAPVAEKRPHLIVSSEEVAGPLMELLTGIVHACRINMDQVNIIHAQGPMGYTGLLGNYGPSYIILFGVEPSQLDLPIVFPQFQMQRFANATWVASPELGLIRNDKAMKTKLWNCLKNVYGI